MERSGNGRTESKNNWILAPCVKEGTETVIVRPERDDDAEKA